MPTATHTGTTTTMAARSPPRTWLRPETDVRKWMTSRMSGPRTAYTTMSAARASRPAPNRRLVLMASSYHGGTADWEVVAASNLRRSHWSAQSIAVTLHDQLALGELHGASGRPNLMTRIDLADNDCDDLRPPVCSGRVQACRGSRAVPHGHTAGPAGARRSGP